MDDELVERVKDLIMLETYTGPNTLNDYFTSIGPSLAENIDNNEYNYSQFVNRVNVDGIFHFQPVSSSQVYKLLNSLSVCKASGIAKISAKVLK